MSRLEVKRLDSPLARNTGRRDRTAEDDQPRGQEVETPARPKRRPAVERAPRLASVPQAPRSPTEGSADPFEALPDPPALDESLELLSTRLPISLRRSLSEFTGALRTRDGERVSQKSLPEQEVLAVLVWLAGSAQDPRAIARFGAALDAYRARRYVAAAKALRPSAPGDESP